MSKSNADFSAFDFNDSSDDNSDITTRTPFLSRTTNVVNNNGNNNNNNNNSNDSKNNNNNNNNHHEHHNNNSNSQHSNHSQHSQKSRGSSSSSTTSSESSSSSTSSHDNLSNTRRTNADNIVVNAVQANTNEQHMLEARMSNGQRSGNGNSNTGNAKNTNNNNNNNNTNTHNISNNNARTHDVDDDEDDDDDDDEDDDDDDDDDEEYDDDDEDESNSNTNNNTNNNNNNNNNNNSNNVRNSDGLLIGTALKRNKNGCGNLDNATGSGNPTSSSIATSMAAAAAAVAAAAAAAAVASNATSMNNSNNNNNNDASSHSIVGGLLEAGGRSAIVGGSNLNCSELARSASASLSNSGSTTAGGNMSLTGANAGMGGSSSERKKYRHQNYSKNIYIGTKNAEKWELTRARLQFKNDVEFVAYLLNFADNDTERLANLPPPSTCTTPTKSFSGNFKLEPNLSAKEFAVKTDLNAASAVGRKKSKKRVQFSDSMVNGIAKMKDFSNFALKVKKHDQKMKTPGNRSNINADGNGDMLPEVLDCRIAEKIKSELAEKTSSSDALPNALCLKKGNNYTHDDEDDDADADAETDKVASGTSVSNVVESSQQSVANFRMRVKNKKSKVMLPYAAAAALQSKTGTLLGMDDDVEDDEDTGSEDEELDEEALAREMRNEQNFVEEDDEHDMAFRSQQSCRDCSLTHDYKVCPLRNAIGIITDAVDLSEWIERKNLEALAKLKANAQRHAKPVHDDDEDMDESSQMSDFETKPLITFAEASVPAEFELHNVEPHVTGVFARTDVRAFTKLGPLIGQAIQSTDLREGSNMKWIFEICEPGAEKSHLLCCDNPNTSNWLRYIRPSPTYEERTVNLVSIERQAFFVTSRDLKNGMELLYWSDECNTMWRKKQNDKTTCGGCNMKFDHSLYYRTHCSIFHDPTMSLTIRRYHCKVCGDFVLGKDNIMKHAAEVHDGKGAYQCQFCNKFFLRLNYLEMHRTYGCASNPNRARPLCDFCGRKFCQPQKLKSHIKRMHSDMAEVLRDFQCKLCSKLLGSRAALQRHSKEVHSRNSTVVSCPRCQKLFQNRSNLKIHMLTHSGVRPFKCAEPECNAAFTTKQCLQFHYKKVHNYTQEQMPKIERSVAYTFDAYSGGMKVDFLEQAPRRRRKSLEDQNSMLSSSMQSDTEFSDDNIFEAIKKSGKSIKDLCRNEPNLSLLSSKISSIFGDKVAGSRKRKKKKDLSNSLLTGEEDEDVHMEHVRRKQNAQLSLVESFLTTTAQRLQQQQVQQVVAAAAAVSAMAATSVADDPSKMHAMMPALNAQHMGIGHAPGMNHEDDDDDDDDEDDVHDQQHNTVTDAHHDNNSYRHHAALNPLGHNLVVSKGSKKWISDDDRHIPRDCLPNERCGLSSNDIVGNSGTAGDGSVLNAQSGNCALPVSNSGSEMGLPNFAVPSSNVDDTSKLIGQNRDFLARLMNSATAGHSHHNTGNREDDENTSFLDVVESNNNVAAAQMSQYHHSSNSNVNTGAAANASSAASSTDANTPSNQTGNSDMQMSSLSHTQSFMSSFYNNANANGRLSGPGGSASTSASMLVEAALNSVGNMIDADNNELKVPSDNHINTDSPMSSHVDSESNRYTGSSNNAGINSMDNLEKELTMMKSLSNFPMQIPPLPMFPNTGNDMSSCNISPNASTPTNPQSNQNQANNDVDVDSSSTPRQQNLGGSAADSDGFSSTHHRTPPSPQPISPGRDYGGMFGTPTAGSNGTPGASGTAGSTSSANSNTGTSVTNNISSSPLQTMQSQRRTASSVGSTYPDHELISPASSPSIPRYNFNGEMMRQKRAEAENERRQNIGHNHLSSDEESSLMPQNSVSGQDMRMKFSQPQMDLMYSKYESMSNAANLKYNNQGLDSPGDYRSSNSNTTVTTAGTPNEISDLQGLDMSSRSGVSSSSNYHHNFQLPGSAASNLPSIGRYHHHIYDILSEREQSQQSQAQSAQQQHHSTVTAAAVAAAQHQQQEHSSQLQAMQHQSAMHNMLSDQLSEQEHDQATSVDLSRTANYVVPSPPQLPYNHPHHDMLRMASLDLTPNTNMSVGNNRSFLSSQMQHQSRESLEHHRLLSTVEQHRILAASNAADQHRLLVDPTAHLLMEQNNRLLGTDQSRLLGDTAQNRHMARSFGAYHQVASGNYHHGVRPPVLPSPNHHASNPSNYHPFPAYY